MDHSIENFMKYPERPGYVFSVSNFVFRGVVAVLSVVGIAVVFVFAAAKVVGVI